MALLLASTVVGPTAATGLLAQSAPPPLELRLQGSDGRVEAVLGPILTTRGTIRSLESGLPVRIQIVVELWRDQFFDSQDGRFEWRATVRQDPLSNRFLVETADGDQGNVLSPDAALAFLQANLTVPLRPLREGRYYYLGRVEVETLSLSDIDELRRWLQGDLGAAVEGGEQVGSALGRGFRRLLVRALGLPVQRYQARTPTFEIPR
ncbi:MAG: hypothetical protein EA351_04215 [Gemmatimonadales bacterium]|nr:MAG: hypothetical protein EA351_04215 [Gemmatimonadales bacterium]